MPTKDILLTRLGTCRLFGLDNFLPSTNIDKLISFSHSTKEHLQLLDFISGNLSLNYPYNRYCFRSSIIQPKQPCYVLFNSNLKERYDKTTFFVIEISSNKLYIYNNKYLHHLAVDKRFDEYKMSEQYILDNTQIKLQDFNEIEYDILKIKEKITPRPFVIVTHINAKQNGQVLKRRNDLIVQLEEICIKNNIPIFNPSVVLKTYKQDDIILNDLGHYTVPFGLNVIGKLLYNKILTIINERNIYDKLSKSI